MQCHLFLIRTTTQLWSSSWSPLALLDKKGARTDGGRTETSCANSPTKKRFSETETDFFQKPFIKLRLAQTNKLTYSGTLPMTQKLFLP